MIPSPVANVNPAEIFPTHDVQFVGFILAPYATCTPPTHAPSVAHTILKFVAGFAVADAPRLIFKAHHTGAVVSSLIVLSNHASVSFPKLSLHLIQTFFVPSPDERVIPVAAVHDCQSCGVSHGKEK